MNYKNLITTSLMFMSLILVLSCAKDDDDLGTENGDETYKTEVYITDAPIDNANVQAAFITVSNVMVNGESIDGFTKTTINISSLQDGNTELLGELELESGTTSNLTLVLDNQSDDEGVAPGSYILTAEGEKKALTTSSNEIIINDEVNIETSNDNEIVFDFDLRKTIVQDQESNEYSYVSDSEMSNRIRAVNTLHTGIISGTVTGIEDGSSDTMLVFAYRDGTYEESEIESDSGVQFSNAVTSSVVNNTNGDFELHFIEEGDYELHFVSFSEDGNNGILEFEGKLDATSTSDLNLLGFSVDANTEVSVEVMITGFLNL